MVTTNMSAFIVFLWPAIMKPTVIPNLGYFFLIMAMCLDREV